MHHGIIYLSSVAFRRIGLVGSPVMSLDAAASATGEDELEHERPSGGGGW